MNPDLEHLIVLQAQDLDLSHLRSQIADAPRRVAAAEAALQAADKALAAVRSSLAAEEKLRRGQDIEIASARTKLDRVRRSLDTATSAAQVTAFEHEIKFTEAAIAKLDDEAFASLERTEALEPQEKDALAVTARRRSDLDTERARAERTIAENKASIADIEEQRRQLRPQIAEEWLAVYDRLTKSKGTALAEATGTANDGKCSACQMTVRTQRWRDLTGRDHDDTIYTCETCGRMLFWDPRRDTPRPWEAGDRLRRAGAGSAR